MHSKSVKAVVFVAILGIAETCRCTKSVCRRAGSTEQGRRRARARTKQQASGGRRGEEQELALGAEPYSNILVEGTCARQARVGRPDDADVAR